MLSHEVSTTPAAIAKRTQRAKKRLAPKQASERKQALWKRAASWREMYKNGIKQREIAKQFGVSQAVVSRGISGNQT